MNDFFISCQESRIENPRSFYGCFYIGPFNSSQSLTVANALRRTLLSELSGIAITSVEIQGAVHEYSTLTGIRDSVLDILLNLKQIVLKTRLTDSTKTEKNKQNKVIRPLIGYLQARGPGIVRAADLKLPASIQCVDPDQYIASLSADGFLNMKVIINEGKNYIIQNPKSHTSINKESAESQFSNRIQNNKINALYVESKQNEQKNIKNISTMPLSIDAVFMPITKVNYVIENHSIKNANAINYIQNTSQRESILQTSSLEFLDPVDQQKAYYEKTFDSHVVILEVWTNGSIHPRRAVYDALKNLMGLFSQLEKMKILNSLFTADLYKAPNKSNDDSEKIFKKIEYEYEYYTDMKNAFKKSKTQTQLSPEAFLRAQKQFEKQYKLEMYNEKELKKIQISSLNISNRSCKLLEESRIYTLADLIKHPDRKLTSIKGFGKKCLQEVKQALEKIGLDFISEKCN
uniref:DNA-directed RNA polymerase subunit alpha n=1 Tax=Bracteacoccus giganteus TaxID=50039 RepID=A0A0S2LQ70_9CHLO|nr:alpha subunit of RNA polymerase [Bracteacoccus giganteus]ALO63534.1 alpha subunit of RNA polymerase [Bracteacoccus giganteus]